VTAIFENRRTGKDRRRGERRRSAAQSMQIPEGQDRRSGDDRRKTPRRFADREDSIPERYDYLWRNRWP
jgi:hypothetical protein